MCLYEGLRLKQTLRKKVRGGPPTTPTTFVQAAGVLLEEMLEIEKQRGRDSQGPNSTKNLVENEGDAQTRAAEKINADVSGETLRKGKNVKEKAEADDEPELAATNTRVWLLKPGERQSGGSRTWGACLAKNRYLPNREAPTDSVYVPHRNKIWLYWL